MRICEKDGNTHIIFEDGDQSMCTTDGMLWWDTGHGLKLQFHIEE
jgi:hypothetical protein